MINFIFDLVLNHADQHINYKVEVCVVFDLSAVIRNLMVLVF